MKIELGAYVKVIRAGHPDFGEVGKVVYLSLFTGNCCDVQFLGKRCVSFHPREVKPIEGEDLLNAMVLHQISKRVGGRYRTFRYRVDFQLSGMRVGCQKIRRDAAVEIAKDILEVYGD